MQTVNPFSISYTKNQSDSKFLSVSLDSSSIGTPNPVNADTLSGKPISDFVLKSDISGGESLYKVKKEIITLVTTTTPPQQNTVLTFNQQIDIGDELIINLQRESRYYTSYYCVLLSDLFTFSIPCFPNDNHGATIFNNCIITRTNITFKDWFCGIEYNGTLGQNLCTAFTVFLIKNSIVQS